MRKVCFSCHADKPTTEFNRRSASKDGLNKDCRDCSRAKQRAYWINNPEARERRLAESKAWREANPDRVRENNAHWYQGNKSRAKENGLRWIAKNPERSAELRAERWRRWAERNADKCRESNARSMRKPERRIARQIWGVLRGRKSGRRWSEILGYGEAELRAHLERQFLRGMNWDNYGEWHIDHIVPLVEFDVTGPDCPELRRAWALTNLRPLWAEDNLKKNRVRKHLL